MVDALVNRDNLFFPLPLAKNWHFSMNGLAFAFQFTYFSWRMQKAW